MKEEHEAQIKRSMALVIKTYASMDTSKDAVDYLLAFGIITRLLAEDNEKTISLTMDLAKHVIDAVNDKIGTFTGGNYE